MKRAVSVATVALLIGGLCTSAASQVARQGDPAAKPIPTAFYSPMILEVPFIAADRSTWGKDWQQPQAYIDLGRYTVDNVALKGRSVKSGWESGLQVRTTLRPNNHLEIEIGAQALNPSHNHDKSVMLFFEFLNGRESIGTATLGPIGAHDDNSPTKPMSIKVTNISPDQLKTDPMTMLKITVTTKDW